MADFINRRKEMYQELLWEWIECNSESSDESLKRFVDAFSCFICSSDPAYKYNFPFLPDQFRKFMLFRIRAQEKVERLRMVFNELKKSDVLRQYEINNLQVSINNFLELDISGKIKLCESFSLIGAEDKGNVLTIRYKKPGLEYLCTCGMEEPEKLQSFIEELLHKWENIEEIQDNG